MKKLLSPLLLAVIMLVICGLMYPLLMTGVAQVVFPYQANGSMIKEGDKPIASALIGQQYTAPYYLQGRVSAVHYNTYTNLADFAGVASGSFNYAPSNPALQERMTADIAKFLAQNPTVKRADIPAELMTASGSGLDPHITVASANIQVPRIVKASGLSTAEVQQIIEANTTNKEFGIFGQVTVNVVTANLAIKAAMAQNS